MSDEIYVAENVRIAVIGDDMINLTYNDRKVGLIGTETSPLGIKRALGWIDEGSKGTLSDAMGDLLQPIL